MLLQQQRLVALIGLGANEDTACALAASSGVGHIERVREGSVLQMPEVGANVLIRSWAKVQASRQIGCRSLPVGEQSIGACIGCTQLGLDIVDGHVGESQLLVVVGRQQSLVLVANGVDEAVPSVEDRITHRCGHISHYTELLQMAGIGIVRERDDCVSLIVQIAIVLAVHGQRWGSLDQVAQNVDAALGVQRNALAFGLQRNNMIVIKLLKPDKVE